MPEIQKVSVALTGEQVHALKSAVASGAYATTSEVVREALRDWQRKRELHGEDIEHLRKMWLAGKQSGPASRADLNDIRRKAKQQLKKAVARR